MDIHPQDIPDPRVDQNPEDEGPVHIPLGWVKKVNDWQPPMGEPLDEDLERRIEEESRERFGSETVSLDEIGLPAPMTNDQIAEMIVCMTEGEKFEDVLDRVIHWTAEEWSQCDPERNARQLTRFDELEIIGRIATKFAKQVASSN
jgi:hypothetical protein